LPEELSIEILKGKHPSYPRNKKIAEVFFKAGYIEAWGRGISMIMDACRKAGLPEPLIEEYAGGIQITFLKDIYTEGHLRKLGLNVRQIKAVLYVKEHEEITNAKYQELTNVSKATATRDLQELIEKKILRNVGRGVSSSYFIIGSNGS
jgi:ATP-dependent DNA helicase RecG